MRVGNLLFRNLDFFGNYYALFYQILEYACVLHPKDLQIMEKPDIFIFLLLTIKRTFIIYLIVI